MLHRAAFPCVITLLLWSASAPVLPADAPAKQTVAGKCLDDEGQPVSGVEVELFRLGVFDGSKSSIASLTTGPDGAYRFDNLDPGTRDNEFIYDLMARRPGHASARKSFNFLLGRIPESVTLSRNTGMLSGRITDEQGRPVVKALVSCDMRGFEPVHEIMAAETDANGRYEIADLRAFAGNPGTRIHFWISHPDYARVTGSYSAVPSVVDVTLPKGGLIEGTVTDAVTGKPAASAQVLVQGVKERGAARTTVDAEGRYRLRLTPDLYNIRAEATDRTCFCVDSHDVQNGGKSEVNLELIEGGLIVGRITDERGKPLSRLGSSIITIGHHGPAFPRSGAAVGGATVEDDGTYRMRVAPGDNYPYIMSDVSTERSPRTLYDHPPIHVAPGQEVQLDMTVITGK